LASWVARVRKGLEGRVPASLATPERDALLPRPRPYLEPLEPRILLSADVGLVPDALLAPPPDLLDPRAVVEPAIHDDVLVREPSRFVDVASEVLAIDPLRLPGLTADPGPTIEPPLDAAPSSLAPGVGEETGDPESAARALAEREWHAEWAVSPPAAVSNVDQIVVVDARTPEVSTLLEALLEQTDGLTRDASPTTEPVRDTLASGPEAER
jgi:hypothetical protein